MLLPPQSTFLRLVTDVHPIGSAKKTPKSTKATPKKRAPPVKKEAGDGEDDVEESPTKKKKTPSKKKVAAGPDVVKSIEKKETGSEEEQSLP